MESSLENRYNCSWYLLVKLGKRDSDHAFDEWVESKRIIS